MTNNINNTQELTFEQLEAVNGGFILDFIKEGVGHVFEWIGENLIP